MPTSEPALLRLRSIQITVSEGKTTRQADCHALVLELRWAYRFACSRRRQEMQILPCSRI